MQIHFDETSFIKGIVHPIFFKFTYAAPSTCLQTVKWGI